jgi:hypothetical protein
MLSPRRSSSAYGPQTPEALLCYLFCRWSPPAITPLVEEPRSSTLAGASSRNLGNKAGKVTLAPQCIGAISSPPLPKRQYLVKACEKPGCPPAAGFLLFDLKCASSATAPSIRISYPECAWGLFALFVTTGGQDRAKRPPRKRQQPRQFRAGAFF